MRVRLAYGTTGLDVDVPDDACVVWPRAVTALAEPAAAFAAALRNPLGAAPLRELARGRRRVVVSICDVTRPQPRAAVLRAILDELADVVRDEAVTVLVATGTHRGCTPGELTAMLGAAVVGRLRVVNHDARDEASLADLGVLGAGVPTRLNHLWMDADLRISTGVVEPHFFAGFSGGPKMIAPGLAGLDTVLALHDERRIGDPRATWGVLEGNPVHDDVRAIARVAPSHFSIDVTLGAGHEVACVFAGELFAAHAAAVAEARAAVMCNVPQRFDVVVTSNAGYPLDQNLYQAVKGMAAAARVVKPGGTIVCAAACRDGLPDGGAYARLVQSGPFDPSGPTVPDQWQVQIQAAVQRQARVVVKSDGVPPATLRRCGFEPTDDVSATVREALARGGAGARACVLPAGPRVVASAP
jgi:nickel-dependent lactate racemase